ncbi:MAG: ferritin-like domain-containing protein [Kofleriaceae bacterium]
MAAVVVLVFGLVVTLCTWIGVKLIARGVRASKVPVIPPARTANAEGADAAYATAHRIATRAPRKIGKGVLVSLGAAVIAAPWLFVYGVYKSLGDMDMTKGRVLRIKNRAQLPELATGEGWSTQDVVLDCTLTAGERRVLGELWLLTARMEHASVAAFSQLSLHLAALGAPARLLTATHTAALEEIRHAEHCFAIARAITGVPHTAGPITALDRGSDSAIDLSRLAIGSLVDGCLAEGIASDVASQSAQRADEPTIRATLAMIGREEAGHAELAWDVLAWCLAHGDDALHHAVATRVEALGNELTPRLPAIANVDDAALSRYGVIDQHSLGAIASARVAAVQQRARRMLAVDTRLAA